MFHNTNEQKIVEGLRCGRLTMAYAIEKLEPTIGRNAARQVCENVIKQAAQGWSHNFIKYPRGINYELIDYAKGDTTICNYNSALEIVANRMNVKFQTTPSFFDWIMSKIENGNRFKLVAR